MVGETPTTNGPQWQGFNSIYNLFINKNKSVEENELGFLNLMSFMDMSNNNTGLTLMKVDGTGFAKWQKVELQNGTVKYVKCN